ncbi:hypothetical protein NEFER03_1267 [Nematocida sp. LUAm3]|nr:hypothetical protein NEFER03_1267 [Nematocida sp. LUAm3]KAI5174111.1 hypothetical protein NEFER02_0578 [Nematocida sp. LUAm2]KAI5177146.1 hypothetical protein NEFER01_0421 [Nematocida sp. LUAm1]
MDSKNNWQIKTTEEHSYLRVLQKCYENIQIDIHDDSLTITTNPEGVSVKGPGKGLSLFLGAHGVSEEAQKRITDVISLRPQQMIAYAPQELGMDVVIAIAKVRKWIIEGQITNKITENIAEKLYEVHEKYQEFFCEQTKEVIIPKENIALITTFYKVVIQSGHIDSIIDHPEADTLYIENVDFVNEKRTIVSGLKGKIEKDDLCNRSCLFTLNLKPVSFKSTKSYGMILFAKDKETENGSPIFTENPGKRLELKGYTMEQLGIERVTVGDCTKRTLESFFSQISVKDSVLMYSDLITEIDGNTIEVNKVKNGTIS